MVGHVEWITFLRVPSLPVAGEIVQAEEMWEQVGGGGAVAAAQMARLAGQVHFFTALGQDSLGEQAFRELQALGIETHVAWRPPPQRRAVTHLDRGGERTITVIGPRLAPQAQDPLPWDLLDACSGCYFTAGSAHQARRSRHLLATTRSRHLLEGVTPDAWVGSRQDSQENTVMTDAPCVLTEGAAGGRYWQGDREGRYLPSPLPGPGVDAYGCGDSFAGALAFALGSGMDLETSLQLAARCGAACFCGKGPYEGQLSGSQLFR